MQINWKGKGQIFLGVAAIMLIAAGYLNYSGQNSTDTMTTGKMLDAEEMASIGDATFVSSSATVENEQATNLVQNEASVVTSSQEEKTGKESKNEYFTKSRLERDKMYAASLESYQKIVESSQMTTEQKSIAGEEIQKINQEKNAVMITENLIQTKGFEEVVLFVNVDSVSVVVKAEKLTDEQIAQIQNIVSRELKADVEDIHISIK